MKTTDEISIQDLFTYLMLKYGLYPYLSPNACVYFGVTERSEFTLEIGNAVLFVAHFFRLFCRQFLKPRFDKEEMNRDYILQFMYYFTERCRNKKYIFFNEFLITLACVGDLCVVCYRTDHLDLFQFVPNTFTIMFRTFLRDGFYEAGGWVNFKKFVSLPSRFYDLNKSSIEEQLLSLTKITYPRSSESRWKSQTYDGRVTEELGDQNPIPSASKTPIATAVTADAFEDTRTVTSRVKQKPPPSKNQPFQNSSKSEPPKQFDRGDQTSITRSSKSSKSGLVNQLDVLGSASKTPAAKVITEKAFENKNTITSCTKQKPSSKKNKSLDKSVKLGTANQFDRGDQTSATSSSKPATVTTAAAGNSDVISSLSTSYEETPVCTFSKSGPVKQKDQWHSRFTSTSETSVNEQESNLSDPKTATNEIFSTEFKQPETSVNEQESNLSDPKTATNEIFSTEFKQPETSTVEKTKRADEDVMKSATDNQAVFKSENKVTAKSLKPATKTPKKPSSVSLQNTENQTSAANKPEQFETPKSMSSTDTAVKSTKAEPDKSEKNLTRNVKSKTKVSIEDKQKYLTIDDHRETTSETHGKSIVNKSGKYKSDKLSLAAKQTELQEQELSSNKTVEIATCKSKEQGAQQYFIAEEKVAEKGDNSINKKPGKSKSSVTVKQEKQHKPEANSGKAQVGIQVQSSANKKQTLSADKSSQKGEILATDKSEESAEKNPEILCSENLEKHPDEKLKNASENSEQLACKKQIFAMDEPPDKGEKIFTDKSEKIAEKAPKESVSAKPKKYVKNSVQEKPEKCILSECKNLEEKQTYKERKTTVSKSEKISVHKSRKLVEHKSGEANANKTLDKQEKFEVPKLGKSSASKLPKEKSEPPACNKLAQVVDETASTNKIKKEPIDELKRSPSATTKKQNADKLKKSPDDMRGKTITEIVNLEQMINPVADKAERTFTDKTHLEDANMQKKDQRKSEKTAGEISEKSTSYKPKKSVTEKLAEYDKTDKRASNKPIEFSESYVDKQGMPIVKRKVCDLKQPKKPDTDKAQHHTIVAAVGESKFSMDKPSNFVADEAKSDVSEIRIPTRCEMKEPYEGERQRFVMYKIQQRSPRGNKISAAESSRVLPASKRTKISAKPPGSPFPTKSRNVTSSQKSVHPEREIETKRQTASERETKKPTARERKAFASDESSSRILGDSKVETGVSRPKIPAGELFQPEIEPFSPQIQVSNQQQTLGRDTAPIQNLVNYMRSKWNSCIQNMTFVTVEEGVYAPVPLISYADISNTKSHRDEKSSVPSSASNIASGNKFKTSDVERTMQSPLDRRKQSLSSAANRGESPSTSNRRKQPLSSAANRGESPSTSNSSYGRKDKYTETSVRRKDRIFRPSTAPTRNRRGRRGRSEKGDDEEKKWKRSRN